MGLKEITDREKSFLVFNSAVKEGLEKVLASLEKIIVKLAGPDYQVRDLLGLPLELVAHLKRLLDRLIETDDQVVDLELTERACRQEVRQIFVEVRQELLRMRDALRTLYGKKGGDVLMMGVPKRIPRNVVEHLLRMSDTTLHQLQNPNLDLPLAETLRHLLPKGHGRKDYAKVLSKKVERLRAAHERQLETKVLLEGARAEKTVAMRDYNTSFPDIAKIFECLFRLARQPAWTKQLKPSGQDKGLLLAESRLRRSIRAGIKESKERRRETEPTASNDDPDAES